MTKKDMLEIEKKIAYQKEYYQQNKEVALVKNRIRSLRIKEEAPEKVREYSRRYRQSIKGKATGNYHIQKRRAHRQQVHHAHYSFSEIEERLTMFSNKCAYCEATATAIDHAIALSKGGPNVPSNLLPSCQRCNSSKAAKPIDAWYKQQPFFTKARWRRILKALNKTEATLYQLPLL